jgi:hypothetical protein
MKRSSHLLKESGSRRGGMGKTVLAPEDWQDRIGPGENPPFDRVPEIYIQVFPAQGVTGPELASAIKQKFGDRAVKEVTQDYVLAEQDTDSGAAYTDLPEADGIALYSNMMHDYPAGGGREEGGPGNGGGQNGGSQDGSGQNGGGKGSGSSSAAIGGTTGILIGAGAVGVAALLFSQ